MQNSKNRLMKYFSERFGVDKGFWSNLKVHEKGKSLWITSNEVSLLDKFVASGIRTLRIFDHGFKPTTYVLRLLNKEIKRNVVKLSKTELLNLIRDGERIETDLSRGYVALRFRGDVIGCGLIDSKGLRSQIPKGLSQELEEIF